LGEAQSDWKTINTGSSILTDKHKVIIIGGPTASGKSGLAVQYAQRNNGIIINADSMQIYNDLPNLTAQPTEEEKQQCPHTLYAILDPAEKCDAAQWRNLALKEINRAIDTKQVPILVGGTGFYIKALTEGLSPLPDIPIGIREKTIKLQKELGNPKFHALLSEKDPVMAERLDPNNTQRLVRSWEVLEATGKSLAEWQSLPLIPPPENLEFIFVALMPDREILYERCNKRFENMVELGIVDEVESFMKKIKQGIIPEDASLAKSVGYPEIRDYLQDKINKEEAITLAQQKTRNYAKRQMTWLRNQVKPELILNKPDLDQLIKIIKN